MRLVLAFAACVARCHGQPPPPFSRVALALKTGSDSQQTDALARLASFAADPSFDSSQMESILPTVMMRLKAGTAAQKEKAAGLVLNLAAVPENRFLLERYYVIKPLIDIVRPVNGATRGAVAKAAGALQNLAASPPLRISIAKLGGISALIAAQHIASGPVHACLHNLAQHRELKAIMLEKGYAPYGQTFNPKFDNPGGVSKSKRQVFFREQEYVRPFKSRIEEDGERHTVVWKSTKHIVDERGRHTYQGGYSHRPGEKRD